MAAVQQMCLMPEVEACLKGVSHDKRKDHLHDGVLFDQQRKKFWVDRKTGHNCFMLYARNLSISWGDDKRYWSWPFMNDTSSNASIEVAELLHVCWLEIKGKFDTSYLSSETLYEVAFEIMLKDNAYGFEHPVTLKLELPNGETHERTECLQGKPHDKWMTLRVGEFMTCPCDKKGEMHFSMKEIAGGQWKKGLVVKGAIIRPIMEPKC